jgi:hypothetical protein
MGGQQHATLHAALAGHQPDRKIQGITFFQCLKPCRKVCTGSHLWRFCPLGLTKPVWEVWLRECVREGGAGGRRLGGID